MIELAWTRINPDGPGLHAPKLRGDVGFDLEAAYPVTLGWQEEVDVDTNVRVKLPPTCWAEIRARSSIARRGLQVVSTVIDNGYTGSLFVLLRNVNHALNGARTDVDWAGRVEIGPGERIAQLVLHYGVWATAVEYPDIEHDVRRGERAFGSTGR